MQVNPEVESGSCAVGRPSNKTITADVRSVFEDTSKYLISRYVDIRFRVDTVSSFAARMERKRVLDIGCGDGTISLQLVRPDTRLTLMDLSSSMIATAKTNIPEGSGPNVELRNENFATAYFGDELFDLIVSVGVMAHVDSPDEFLRKIRALLRPGGNLILEFTDTHHFVGRIGRMWSWVKELAAPARYATNKYSYRRVSQLFEAHGLRVVSMFRYSRIPIPGFNLIVSHAREYKLVKAIFGTSDTNRNAWLGNEYIIWLKAE